MKMRPLLLGALALLASASAIVLANTYRKSSRQENVPAVPHVAVDRMAAAERLAAAVRARTVSYDKRPDASAAEFQKLHQHLERSFPQVHERLRRETVAEHSLLYTWPGTDSKAKPIMLMAHMDVVPIAEGTEKDWSVDPFAGVIRDGYVWGRGAWDNKSNLLAILEAAELLIAEGFRPRQTIYIVAGHDEEVGGDRGAYQVAQLLKSRSVQLDFVIDEGTLITNGVIKGLEQPVALIGVAEKGMMTLALHAHDTPGHASMPPRETSIGMLGAALARLEENPMPAAIGGVAAEMFDTLAPEMRGMQRVVLSNLWLFGPLVKKELERSRSSNAFTRTTSALTVVQAGNKVNVVPAHANAYVNVRMLPGNKSDDVVHHVRSVIDDTRIDVGQEGKVSEASQITSSKTPSYGLLNRTIREVFPGTVVAPGLMVAATDSRHMLPIADNVYRFSPVRALEADLSRFHGTNERLSVSNYLEMISFYHRLISATSVRH